MGNRINNTKEKTHRIANPMSPRLAPVKKATDSFILIFGEGARARSVKLSGRLFRHPKERCRYERGNDKNIETRVIGTC
jgi:hypothetical protein